MTLKLSDIDYQIAPESTQEGIIEQYARFLNSFDSQHSLQVSVVNRYLDKEALRNDVELSPRGDGVDQYRHALNEIIRARLASGRNNTVTDKYLTITVKADDYQHAAMVLARVEAEACAQLRSVGGCKAERVSGEGRLQVLHSILRPGSPFSFSYDQLIGTPLTTKDVICPWLMDFSDHRSVLLGNETDTYFQVLCMRDLPPWLSDRLIREITEINTDLVISVHIRPIDQAEGLNLVKRQIAGMDMQTIQEQEKARKRGYSENLIPHELVVAHEEATQLRRQLEQSNERLFSTTILVGVRGVSPEDLKEQVAHVRSVARKQSCVLEDLRYMQEDALNAVLPLGTSNLPIFRTVTTATAAIMIPFTTQEVMHKGGIYYGVNDTSKNLIIGSRAATMNGNAFFLGTSGSGKSQYAKKELTQVLLGRPQDDVVIIDPEKEYWALGEVFGATRIDISTSSRHSINPMELHRDAFTDDGNPIKAKAEFILSMCEVLLGGATGLSPAQRSVIDRCATAVYHEYWNSPVMSMPTLATLHKKLLSEKDPAAWEVAAALELYATGSFSGFARQTNVDTGSRFTIYDISSLGAELKTFGMLVVLEQIWNRVIINRAQGRRTWLYIDEFHLLFTNEYAGAYCQMLYKRARKWGLLPTGITQNIDELLLSDRARLMLANCAVVTLLGQTPTDADALQELFGFSDKQREKFTHVSPGQGLLKMGDAIVPFDDRIPTDSILYSLFTTKFAEMQLADEG